MASINLRPWREELRAERQKQFLTILMGVAIVAAGLLFLWNTHVESQIEYQTKRNGYLETAMKELDKKTEEIKELKAKEKKLLERMKVIQDLQGTRPVIVRVFDELVQTLPDGLYYNSVDKKADMLTIKGNSESNNRISALMRNFDASEWFANPNLRDVSAVKGEESLSGFDLTVQQVAPRVKGEAEGGAK